MAIERLTSATALANMKGNPFAKWPSRNTGNNRIEPLAKPAIKPGFRLDAGAKVFTIGSCFARHVESALVKRGFDVPAWRLAEQIPEFQMDGRTALNNYNVASIHNELTWALDPDHPFLPEHSFVEVYPEHYVDVHLHRVIVPASLATVARRRRIIIDTYKTIVGCPLIVITLGLSECWYDKTAELYLNVRPNRLLFTAEPERYELHVFDYDETMERLRRTFDLLAAHCRADRRVLLTVSPVPMRATHRDMDVLIANGYSKAVLRAAAEAVAASYDFVEYYPSYESVTLSRRDLAWLDDQIHVSADLVNMNIERMIAAYVGGGEDAGGAGLDPSQLEKVDAIRFGRVPAHEVVAFMAERQSLIEEDAELRAAYCDACIAMGEVDKAGTILRKFSKGWNPVRLALLQARWQLARGNAPRAADICGRCMQLHLRKNEAHPFLVVHLKAAIASGGAKAAVAVMQDWQAHLRHIKEGEPYRLLAMALAGEGDYEAAERMFRQMMRSSGGPSGPAIIDFAQFLNERGRTQEAMDLLDLVDDKSPEVLNRLAALGAALMESEVEAG